jgi:hypothetical protein
MTMAKGISAVFMGIANLATAMGIEKINEIPGCWEHQIDEKWWVSLNGHKTPMTNSKGNLVQPYNAMLMYGDWPAGIVTPYGGALMCCVGVDTGETEDALINALDVATAKAFKQ